MTLKKDEKEQLGQLKHSGATNHLLLIPRCSDASSYSTSMEVCDDREIGSLAQ